MAVIDRKTEQAKTFVDKVIKWEENYLTRKEYLGGLKKEYCQSLQVLTSSLAALSENEKTKAVISSA
jgi:hypothetical protein